MTKACITCGEQGIKDVLAHLRKHAEAGEKYVLMVDEVAAPADAHLVVGPPADDCPVCQAMARGAPIEEIRKLMDELAAQPRLNPSRN